MSYNRNKKNSMGWLADEQSDNRSTRSSTNIFIESNYLGGGDFFVYLG
jgi:hypothetical protein